MAASTDTVFGVVSASGRRCGPGAWLKMEANSQRLASLVGSRPGKGIGGGCFGHGRMGWEPLQSVGVAFSASLSDVCPIAAIVMQSRAKVPSGGAVAGVGFADRGLLMHNDVGAAGTAWRSVEVEGAMELGLGGQAWVDARGAEEI